MTFRISSPTPLVYRGFSEPKNKQPEAATQYGPMGKFSVDPKLPINQNGLVEKKFDENLSTINYFVTRQEGVLSQVHHSPTLLNLPRSRVVPSGLLDSLSSETTSKIDRNCNAKALSSQIFLYCHR